MWNPNHNLRSFSQTKLTKEWNLQYSHYHPTLIVFLRKYFERSKISQTNTPGIGNAVKRLKLFPICMRVSLRRCSKGAGWLDCPIICISSLQIKHEATLHSDYTTLEFRICQKYKTLKTLHCFPIFPSQLHQRSIYLTLGFVNRKKWNIIFLFHFASDFEL